MNCPDGNDNVRQGEAGLQPANGVAGRPGRQEWRTARRMNGQDDRLEDLRRRIDEHRAARAAREQARKGRDPRAAAHHLVLRLLADLGVALAAGLLLGYGIDHYFGSRPWGMLGGALLGLAAGVRNVMHTADSMSRISRHDSADRQ